MVKALSNKSGEKVIQIKGKGRRLRTFKVGGREEKENSELGGRNDGTVGATTIHTHAEKRI